MRYILAFGLFSGFFILKAQTIAGTIYDQVNNAVLPGATVQVSTTAKGTVTDQNGEYILSDLSPGRMTLRITFVGYEPVVLTDVWVKSGKVTRQDVLLKQSFVNLDEVEVRKEIQLTTPGRIYITEEQINRFAATYYDPARLVTTAPDVSVSNDQNNRVSARGMSPAYNVWRVEGAEVVNPNHLSNAGTFTDQPTATGGGVNILSAQMLSRSAFLYGAFDNSLNNSTGGIFDMRLKAGNEVQKQYTAQASLIGLDFASEGPISEKVTYSVNYRYSFTGLLTHFGVDFGGESIGFQDLSLNLDFAINERSKLKVFGVGGLSFNDFQHKAYADSETAKDRKDILYDNRTGIIGASMTSQIGSGKLVTTLAASGLNNRRNENLYDNNDQQTVTDRSGNMEALISLHSFFTGKLADEVITGGAMVNYYRRRLSNIGLAGSFQQDQALVQPYLQIFDPLSSQLTLHYGVTYSQTSGDFSLDPRAGLKYTMNAANTFSFEGGVYSQLLNPYNFYYSNPYGYALLEDEYQFIRSGRLTLGHLYEQEEFNIGTEVFYYYFPSVNVGFDERQAGTFGITLNSEKSFDNDLYYRLGGSLFRSIIHHGVPHQYDHRFNISLAGGKEWLFPRGSLNRNFAINGRLLYQGGQNFNGMYYLDIASDLQFISSYRTNPYFRFDLRAQWVMHREKMTNSVSLDLQNVFGLRNESYLYYDAFRNRIDRQYQLGLIPILTYRVEW